MVAASEDASFRGCRAALSEEFVQTKSQSKAAIPSSLAQSKLTKSLGMDAETVPRCAHTSPSFVTVTIPGKLDCSNASRQTIGVKSIFPILPNTFPFVNHESMLRLRCELWTIFPCPSAHHTSHNEYYSDAVMRRMLKFRLWRCESIMLFESQRFLSRGEAFSGTTSSNAWADRTSLRTGDWLCDGCGFVTPKNRASCPKCFTIRSQNPRCVNQHTCPKCDASNHSDRDVCWKCGVGFDLSQNVSDLDSLIPSFTTRVRPVRQLAARNVRIVRHWKCTFCQTVNTFGKGTCSKCHRIAMKP